MNCPVCGLRAEVLQTRLCASHRRRRYSCVTGHRFTTHERVVRGGYPPPPQAHTPAIQPR